MGATGLALVTRDSRILVGHVGDSRAYLWQRKEGLKRLTRDHTLVQKLIDAGIRAMVGHFNMDDIACMTVLAPPLQEQQAIVAWIFDQTKEIDVALARAELEIELIREYRTRLIADAVTGHHHQVAGDAVRQPIDPRCPNSVCGHVGEQRREHRI